MWRRVGAVVHRLRLREVLLGVITVNEVFWRLFTGSLTLPVVSLLALKEVVNADTIGWLFIWAFYFALVFGATPRAFPDAVREQTTSDWFRLLTATTAIGVALATESNLWPDRAIAPSILPPVPDSVLILFSLLMSVGLFGSLWYKQGTTVRDPDGFFIAYVNPFDPTQDLPSALRDHRRERGRDWKYWSVIVFAGIITFITWNLICWFLGLGTLAIGLLYPLPEIVVLAWIAHRVVSDAEDSESGRQWPTRLAVDLNDRILAAAESASQGLKGIVSLLMILFALLVPVIVFAIGLGRLLTDIQFGRAVAVYDLEHWLWIAFVFGNLLLVGLYGVWYWLRELARLPHFLDDHDGGDDDEEDDTLPLLTRPPGYFLAPAALLLLVGVGVDRAATIGSPQIPLWLALVWGGIVSGLAWTTWMAITKAPQCPDTENLALPLAFAVELIAISLLSLISSVDIWTILIGQRPIGDLLIVVMTETPVEPFVLLTGFVGVFYLPDFWQWMNPTANE